MSAHGSKKHRNIFKANTEGDTHKKFFAFSLKGKESKTFTYETCNQHKILFWKFPTFPNLWNFYRNTEETHAWIKPWYLLNATVNDSTFRKKVGQTCQNPVNMGIYLTKAFSL